MLLMFNLAIPLALGACSLISSTKTSSKNKGAILRANVLFCCVASKLSVISSNVSRLIFVAVSVIVMNCLLLILIEPFTASGFYAARYLPSTSCYLFRSFCRSLLLYLFVGFTNLFIYKPL